MKTFPTNYAAMKNSKTGIAPVWIAKVIVDAVTYYLSDQAFAVAAWGITTTPWVKSWGEVREGIINGLVEFKISDLSVLFVIDQAATPNMKTLSVNHAIEACPVEIYQWFIGCTDAPQMVYKGRVRDAAIPTDTTVLWSLQDESILLESLYLGNKLDSATYPLADPDDIGKVIPIVYGTVEKLPALCVDGGWVTSLPLGIDSLQTSITVSEVPVNSIVGKTIVVDDEQMLVTGGGTNQAVGTNWAAASTGATITATTASPGGASLPSNAINGSRLSSYGGDRWISTSPVPSYPQTLTINFAAPKSIELINLFFTASGGVLPEPTLTTTNVDQAQPSFNIYTRESTGAAWVLVVSVTGNNKAWYQTVFAARTVSGISVDFTARCAVADWVNCSEIEAYAFVSTTSKTLTVARAYGGTTAMEHTKGSVVIEKKATPLVYMLADHALTSIGSIFARVRGILVDITSDCTKYVAGFGAYAGKATVAIPDFAKVSQRISIELANSLDVSQGYHTHPTAAPAPVTMTFDTAYAYEGMGWTSYPNNLGDKAIDGNSATFMWANAYGGYLKFKKAATASGATPSSARVSFDYEQPTAGYDYARYEIWMGGVQVLTGALPYHARGVTWTGSFAVSSWAQLSSSNMYVYLKVGGLGKLYEMYVEVTSVAGITPAPATGVSLLGTLGLTGNSVADVMIGDAILCDVTRNISAPAAVFSDLLTTYCNLPAVTLQGGFPASYAFNGAITEYETALRTFNRLALQCRAYFRTSIGNPQLIVRPDTLTSDKTIPSCKITSDGRLTLSMLKTPREDVINLINLLYTRDYTKGAAGAGNFKGVARGSDATSITAYGESERPDLFMFDFVTSPAMADDLLAFYLAHYKDRKWIYEFSTFLDHSELEFADGVTLGFEGNVIGEVQEVRFSPGDKSNMDTIGLVVVG